jgi:hypothetical protein
MSCLFAAVASSAAEIKVLTSVALTSAFNELAPNFEQATGNKLNIGYSLIADIRKRMLDGEDADVIILSRPVMDELDKQQKFASGSVTNVAGTPVALAIRAGATKPDISTVDALKCKIWYLISRTVSDDDAYCGDIDDCSVRAFAVKPAPSARRHAALGLTARRGRANPATVPLMHSTAMAPVINQRTLLSDNVRQVECWFSHMSQAKPAPIRATGSGLFATCRLRCWKNRPPVVSCA